MLELGPTTFIQIVNFIVLLVILKALLWKPLMQALESRHHQIESQIKEAESINEQARSLKEKYEAQISKAGEEAKEILQNITARAEKTKEEILAEAREEAARFVRQAQRDVNLEREKAMGEVKRYLADLTVATAAKVLQESLDPATQQKLMSEFVRKVGEKYVN